MHNILLFLSFLLALAIAVPLNINLGAYSPALVVGDGEISFTGKQDVATLMNALEGAAVSAAANNAAAAAAPAAAEGVTEAKALAPAGNVVPVSSTPVSQDPNTAAIASMQTGVGLGNDLEPRADTVLSSAKRQADSEVSKRDLAGFDRALNYATAALKSSPGVELGTGEGGSGVGIKQLPGGQAAVTNPGKRDLTPLKRRNRVTTLLVRGIDFNDAPEKREVASLQARTAAEASPAAIASRDVDGVNLNIKEGRGLLMRIVEERDVEDDADDEDDEDDEEE